MRKEMRKEKGVSSSQQIQQVDDMSVQLLLLRAVSPQYIRRVVEASSSAPHTHGAGYFELMPLSDDHHPLHTDPAALDLPSSPSSPSDSYSLLSLLKSLVAALLLVRDRDTASLLLRTISIHITAKVDRSLHLALNMFAGEDHHTISNEAILRALL